MDCARSLDFIGLVFFAILCLVLSTVGGFIIYDDYAARIVPFDFSSIGMNGGGSTAGIILPVIITFIMGILASVLAHRNRMNCENKN